MMKRFNGYLIQKSLYVILSAGVISLGTITPVIAENIVKSISKTSQSEPVLVAQSKIPAKKDEGAGEVTEEKVSEKAPAGGSAVPNEIDPLSPDEGEIKATKALTKEDKEELKKKFPCNPIYLSGRGVCAGTGDPGKLAGDAMKMGLGEHPLALEVADLPKDQYGLVNWAEALRTKAIEPWEDLNAAKKSKAKKPLDLNIVIKAKSKFIQDVVFPHEIHTMWLDCSSCHPEIFNRQEGGNPNMTMPKIAAGEYCGRCHNRVAFPLSDCLRCHTKSKEDGQAAAAPVSAPATKEQPAE